MKIGKPYQVFGRWYHPADDRDYDETGIASWYGPGFHARPTANGETYDQDALTAAHKTLPMPSWVEITNLENGRVVTARINDRGPFVDGRIIDLSRRTAQLLDITAKGTARVRVRRVFPDGTPGAAVQMAAAQPAEPRRIDVLPATLTAARFVQVAALSDRARADVMAAALASEGPVRVEPTATGLFRVRIGPFASEAEARAALARVQAAGYADAQLVGAPPLS